MKKCGKCQTEKPIECFNRNRSKRDGRSTECKTCTTAYQKNRKARSPDYFRAKKWESEYGLTASEFKAMELAQNGCCAVCGDPPTGRLVKLCVDHDHKTGDVRGLLCDRCNRAIGFFRDTPDLMRQGAAYIESHAQRVQRAS